MTRYRVHLSYTPREPDRADFERTLQVNARTALAAVWWAVGAIKAAGDGRLVIAVTPDE